MKPERAFGEVLRELRLERGLSQEKLAFEADVQRNYISLLERGQNSVSINILFKLSRVLRTTPSQILLNVEGRLKKPDSDTKRRR